MQETDAELLDKYDFEYVKKCNKPNELRRVIKLLEKVVFNISMSYKIHILTLF